MSYQNLLYAQDAGLSSTDNRKFNNKNGRAFITTQSVKKLKKHLKQWALDPNGWLLPGKNELYDISLLDKDKDTYEKYKSETFYKERWIKEDGLRANNRSHILLNTGIIKGRLEIDS